MFIKRRLPIDIRYLAQCLNARIVKNSNRPAKGLCSFVDHKPDHIAFSNESSQSKLVSALTDSPLAAVIIQEGLDLLSSAISGFDGAILETKDPASQIIDIIKVFYEEVPLVPSISEKADIHSTARIGQAVSIGAFCSIQAYVVIEDETIIHPGVTIYANAVIGRGCVIHSGAVVRENCVIKSGAIIQNGAVIGADGFGYLPGPKGLRKVPQVGHVIIGEEVEVGANSCIDRGTIASTKVGTATKIDNLVQIGHNVTIGSNSILCGQVGVAGSAKIGDQVVLGGSAKVADHVSISSKVRCAGLSGVTADIRESGDYAGFPAVKASKWRRSLAAINRLTSGRKKS
jgi:UDP-3-O-[3-hydroxymyristoyl] glucosamine N-acyltransferase